MNSSNLKMTKLNFWSFLALTGLIVVIEFFIMHLFEKSKEIEYHVNNKYFNEERKIAEKELSKANIAFNVPETMKVAESKTVNLLLSPKYFSFELVSLLKESLVDTNKIIVDSLKISSIMEAFLTGQDFSITAITPPRQRIDKYGKNIWKWEVKALKPGKDRKLYLTLNAIIFDGKDKEPCTIKTYERTIFVYVRFGDKLFSFFNKNWQWVFAAILSPTAVYIWGKIKNRKKAPPETKRRKKKDTERKE